MYIHTYPSLSCWHSIPNRSDPDSVLQISGTSGTLKSTSVSEYKGTLTSAKCTSVGDVDGAGSFQVAVTGDSDNVISPMCQPSHWKPLVVFADKAEKPEGEHHWATKYER